MITVEELTKKYGVGSEILKMIMENILRKQSYLLKEQQPEVKKRVEEMRKGISR